MTVAALIPVRDFATAKQRLRGVLDDATCAGLAAAMLDDVMTAVAAAGRIDERFLLGGDDARRVAARRGWQCLPDPGGGLSAALHSAAAQLAARGIGTLLVLPGDLPRVDAQCIDALLAGHRGGVTVCAAARDGGTNALLLTPPDAIDFQFGDDSARKHLEAGMAAGLPTRRLTLTGCARDIDTADDLRKLCLLQPAGRTGAFLQASGIAARFTAAERRSAGTEQ